MVRSIRNIEQSMGDGIKRPSSSEAKNKPIARKSLVAAKPIRAGDQFTAENITAKRPASGISPMRWDEVIGRVAKRDFAADELISLKKICVFIGTWTEYVTLKDSTIGRRVDKKILKIKK